MSGLSMEGSHVNYTAIHVLDSDQLENVHVDISVIRYCTCQQNLGMLLEFSTCYMMSQAGVQSQRRMYVSLMVIL